MGTDREPDGPDGAGDPVAQLRRLATQAAQGAPLPLDPAHPDAELLELCERVLHNKHHADEVAAAMAGPSPAPLIVDRAEAEARWARNASLTTAWCALCEDSRKLMRRASQVPARTPAGLVAKALICRASRSGAPVLARSMAIDLLAHRAAIWPAPLPGEHR